MGIFVDNKDIRKLFGQENCVLAKPQDMEPGKHRSGKKAEHQSGQIIATSHDLTPNGGLVREIPLFQGILGWWNIIIWPDQWLASGL